MHSIEAVILLVSAIAFWTLVIVIPVVAFRRIGDLRRRVAHLEAELRILAGRTQ